MHFSTETSGLIIEGGLNYEWSYMGTLLYLQTNEIRVELNTYYYFKIFFIIINTRCNHLAYILYKIKFNSSRYNFLNMVITKYKKYPFA